MSGRLTAPTGSRPTVGNVHDKRDSNEPEIVKALLAVGCSVQLLRNCGAGVPDLLVGREGVAGQRLNFLLEVKAPKGSVSLKQTAWHNSWRGSPVRIVQTVEEALAAVGLRVAA